VLVLVCGGLVLEDVARPDRADHGERRDTGRDLRERAATGEQCRGAFADAARPERHAARRDAVLERSRARVQAREPANTP